MDRGVAYFIWVRTSFHESCLSERCFNKKRPGDEGFVSEPECSRLFTRALDLPSLFTISSQPKHNNHLLDSTCLLSTRVRSMFPAQLSELELTPPRPTDPAVRLARHAQPRQSWATCRPSRPTFRRSSSSFATCRPSSYFAASESIPALQ